MHDTTAVAAHIDRLLESFHGTTEMIIFPLQADVYASARLGRTSLRGCKYLEQNTLSLTGSIEKKL
jgi:hypothetical protein